MFTQPVADLLSAAFAARTAWDIASEEFKLRAADYRADHKNKEKQKAMDEAKKKLKAAKDTLKAAVKNFGKAQEKELLEGA